jgi:CelD/BcsL family acetyltransferase involved in cellulose biosynthesis
MALLPLYRVAGRLLLLGSGASDELGPISAPKDREAAAEALGRFLGAAPFPWNAFVGDDMPGDLAWDEVLGGRITRKQASPTLRADGMSWQDFLSTRSANFRGQVRGRERRLWQGHRVVLYETEDPARLERDLETLFGLHVARWGWVHAQKFAGREQRAFLHEFAATALRRGWLRLRMLELDGRPAAAMLNFRFGGSEWYYQGGRDPGFERYSVGFVLQVHAVREALNDGMQSYRFLRGGEAYKQRFANDDAGVVTIRVDNSPGTQPGDQRRDCRA